jgi:hypothetical protein
LRVLDVSENLIESLTGVSKFPKLEVLDMSRNRLSELNQEGILELQSCASLRSLDLSRNIITKAYNCSSGESCHSSMTVPKINSLSIEGNELTPEDIASLKTMFPCLKRLNGELVGKNAMRNIRSTRGLRGS